MGPEDDDGKDGGSEAKLERPGCLNGEVMEGETWVSEGGQAAACDGKDGASGGKRERPR